MKKIFKELLKKFVNKKAAEVVANAEVEPIMSNEEPADDSRKAIWKFITQTLISILTAILTALGATSCMGIH